MLNFFVYNKLHGNDYSIYKCTCGFEKKIYSDTHDKINFCPNCDTPLVNNNSNDCGILSFSRQLVSNNKLCIREIENKKCAVNVDIYNMSGYYEIDFENRNINVYKGLKETNHHYRITFDGSLKIDDMVKAYNMKTNEEISIQQIINNMDDYYDVFINFENFQDLDSYMRTYMTNVCSYYGHKHATKTDVSKLRTFFNMNKHKCQENELLIKAGIDPGFINDNLKDLSGTNPTDLLQLRPYMFKYLKENLNSSNAKLFDALRRIELYFGDQGVHYINTFGQNQSCMSLHFIERINDLVKEANLSISKLYKYLYKEAPLKQGLYSPTETLTLLSDSYELCKKLELPFDKNPKALKRYHDILTREYNIIKDEIKSKEFAAQAEKLQKYSFETEKDNFVIMIPKTSDDLVKEGKAMRHCVGSYIDKFATGKSCIAFLRKKEHENESYVTIEFDPIEKEIYQVKGKCNGLLKDIDAIKFIDKWCKEHLFIWKQDRYMGV